MIIKLAQYPASSPPVLLQIFFNYFKSFAILMHEVSHHREIKHYVYGKGQTVDSCVSQKRDNLPFSTCLTLLRSYSIYLINRQESSLIKSSSPCFGKKEISTCRLPFAVNREFDKDDVYGKRQDQISFLAKTRRNVRRFPSRFALNVMLNLSSISPPQISNLFN